MEKVNDDEVNGEISTSIFAGDLEQLVLGLVPKLALPEPETKLGHHGHFAGGIGVGFNDLGGLIACDDPVIEGGGREGLKGHDVAA